MSSYTRAHQIFATSPKKTLEAFLDGDYSVKESLAETSCDETTTPNTEDSGYVSHTDVTTENYVNGSEPDSTPLLETGLGSKLDFNTSHQVIDAFWNTHNKWTKTFGNPDLKLDFDVESYIKEATDKLFSDSSNEDFGTKLEIANQKLSWLLAYCCQQESDVTTHTLDDSESSSEDEQEDSDGEPAHEKEDGKDQGESVMVEEDTEGTTQSLEAATDEQIEVEEGVGASPDDTDSDDSDSSDSGSDWMPKKKPAPTPATKSKKRSREVYETQQEKNTRWQAYKKRRNDRFLAGVPVAEANDKRLRKEKEINSLYHPFGKVDGLYIGIAPQTAVDLDSDDDLWWRTPFTSIMEKPSSKRSRDEDEDEQPQPAKKVQKTAVYTGRRLTTAQKWFLEKGKIKPGRVTVDRLRPGAKGRTFEQKMRGDWGTPKATLTMAQLNTIRKHAKYTMNQYHGKKTFPQTSMTHREALNFNQFLRHTTSKYALERGDVWEEDPIIDGHLIKYELGKFRQIREGKQARRNRLAAGEDQDSESDLSDDDSKYDDDKATCGWNLEERMERYLAKKRAKEAGLQEEFDEEEVVEQPSRRQYKRKRGVMQQEDEDREEVAEQPRRRQYKRKRLDMEEEDDEEDDRKKVRKPRRKNKGKGRAVPRADEEDYRDDDRKPRRKYIAKNKGKGKAATQVDKEFGEATEDQEETAVWERAGPSQTIQPQEET
ncbi:hypothetical protein ONS96_002532 [Cadophora gregata f. sp. sojae]|nr:hypothetical protein ONS96_002532 [Cadophora gregata f. sp. sojae]